MITVTSWKEYTTHLIARGFYLTLAAERRTEAQWKHAERLAGLCISGEGPLHTTLDFTNGKSRLSIEYDMKLTYVGETCKLDLHVCRRLLWSLAHFGQMLAGLPEGESYEYYVEPDSDDRQLCIAASVLFKVQ